MRRAFKTKTLLHALDEFMHQIIRQVIQLFFAIDKVKNVIVRRAVAPGANHQ